MPVNDHRWLLPWALLLPACLNGPPVEDAAGTAGSAAMSGSAGRGGGIGAGASGGAGSPAAGRSGSPSAGASGQGDGGGGAASGPSAGNGGTAVGGTAQGGQAGASGASGSGGAGGTGGAAGKAGAGTSGAAGASGGCPTATPTSCAGACVNPQTDAKNCGKCGKACDPGIACVGGVCACPLGTADCGGGCLSTGLDEQCGGCGKVCTGGSTCFSGECVCYGDHTKCGAICALSKFAATCGGGCVDTSVSATHCLGCDSPCPAGSFCSVGGCVTDWVQGPLAGELPPSLPFAFTVKGAVVSDARTGLTWERVMGLESGSPQWEAATYCDDLVLDGSSAWRLPTRTELLGLLDFSRTGALVDTSVFSFGAITGGPPLVWTASRCALEPSHVWTIDFESGAVECQHVATVGGSEWQASAWCVR